MFQKGRFKVSLRLKVIVTIFLVYLIVIAGFVLPSMWHQRWVLERETEEAYTSLAKVMAASLSRPMTSGDLLAVKELVATASREKCVVYVLVQDTNNTVLASTEARLDGQALSDATSLKAGSAFNGLLQKDAVPPPGFTKGADYFFEVARPVVVNSEKVGTLRLGIATEEISQMNRSHLFTAMKATIIAALIGGLLALFVDLRMRRALSRLISSTRKMAQGELGQRVDIRTGDELEELGTSFNWMAASLAEREGEIKYLKEYNENIVRSITDGILVLNRDLKVTYGNEALGKIYKKGDGQVEENEIFELLCRADGQELAQNLPRVLKGASYERNVAFISNGREICTSEAWFPVRDSQGEIVGVMARITDVTEQARLEKEIRRYTQDLEEIVKERTRALEDSKSQLMQTQSELMEAERMAALGELTAGVAHEIRTPLNSLAINLQLLKRKVKAGVAFKETLEMLGYEVERVNQVVADFVSFARPPAPKLQKRDLNKVISDMLHLLEAQASRARVALSFCPKRGLPYVEVDGDQLKQVFLNLIVNGIQAMPDGGELTIQTDLHGDNHVEITVVDSGVGIPEENMGKIFNPFFTTKEGGTGLGLAIVARIITGHGGEIYCRSRLNQGTTFQVLLSIRASMANQG